MFVVVNDPKRITNVVNDKSSSQEKHSSKPFLAGIGEKNRQLISENYYPSSAGRALNGPIVATAATTSLVTAGGIVGVGRPSQNSQYPATDEINIPLRGENKRMYGPSNKDHSIGIGQSSSTYGKPSSLVSATMKITSATTEVYQKNDCAVDGRRNNVSERIGNIKDGGNLDANGHSTKFNSLQQQVSLSSKNCRIFYHMCYFFVSYKFNFVIFKTFFPG